MSDVGTKGQKIVDDNDRFSSKLGGSFGCSLAPIVMSKVTSPSRWLFPTPYTHFHCQFLIVILPSDFL
jgi:hypothetical protein